MGCCPFDGAVCCGNGYTCCPSGHACVDHYNDPQGGRGLGLPPPFLAPKLPTAHPTPTPPLSYDVVTTCVPLELGIGGGDNVTGKSVCKPGHGAPLDSSRLNAVILGDSVSIGYTPYVAEALKVRWPARAEDSRGGGAKAGSSAHSLPPQEPARLSV